MDCDLREWTGLMLHLNTSKIGFARRYPDLALDSIRLREQSSLV